MQPELRTAGPTQRQQNFKEVSMALDIQGNAVAVVAVAIPVVGSIALFSFLSVAAWSEARRKEREEYYRNDTLKKIAESSSEGAKAALELLREQNNSSTQRRMEGMKLGGLITAAVGLGVMVLLHGIVDQGEGPVYLVGVIPLLVGLALLTYVFVLAPKQAA
jgi:CBS domain containing-hemolysin-like protein